MIGTARWRGIAPARDRTVVRLTERAAKSRLHAHIGACPACGPACDPLRDVLGACRRTRLERVPPHIQSAVRSAIRRIAEARQDRPA